MNLFGVYNSENYTKEINTDDPAILRSELEMTRLICGWLNEVIEYAPDGIYITDGEANATCINKAYEIITGLKRDEMLGKNSKELLDKGVISNSIILRALEKKTTVSNKQYYASTGKSAVVTSSPVFTDDGEILMIISSVRDITEINELKEQLIREENRNEQIEAQMREIRQMMGQDTEMIAEDEKMVNVIRLAFRVASFDTGVLLTGETGTGKEEIANYIHRTSGRAHKPFMKINCGAIPENLVESELFGYEKGAFTGASHKGKVGLLEAADGGTVFLDEVGELPLDVQVKLLRVIQERTIMRVGGTRQIPIDIRIISATHRNLSKMVSEGTFRQDLYYRLAIVPIEIPPLRERANDILPLARHFLKAMNEEYHLEKSLTPSACRELLEYSWPGNVRELKNMIERAVVITDSDEIGREDLSLSQERISVSKVKRQKMTLKERVERMEYRILKEAYEETHSVRKAAAELGITPPTFVRKRKEYQEKYG